MRGVGLWTRLMLLFLLAASSLLPAAAVWAESKPAAPGAGKLVYVIPAEQTIENGLQRFLERAYSEAEKNQAELIILDINTFGGRVDAAESIGSIIHDSPIPTAAFIHRKAISAGSYIALHAHHIYMEQGSTIGAAAVVNAAGTEVTDAKVMSAWVSLMRGAAELHGRNPDIAEGMVNKNVVVKLPEINKTFDKGELISLTADQALKVGYADGIAETYEEVLKQLGMEGSQLVEMKPSAAERLARILTNPIVTTILFTLGLAGIAIELFVPGFGLPGITGVLCFGLYFFGHYVAGFAGVEDVVLFLIGVVLLIVEIFVPGFGIWAVAGLICLVSGVIMAAYDSANAAVSLGIGFGLALIISIIIIYIFRRRGVWNKFILREELKTELGYVSQSSKEHLLGKTGTTLTTLRPSGTAVFDGERADVVTAGEFIPQGVEVQVVLVEGARVVVREIRV